MKVKHALKVKAEHALKHARRGVGTPLREAPSQRAKKREGKVKGQEKGKGGIEREGGGGKGRGEKEMEWGTPPAAYGPHLHARRTTHAARWHHSHTPCE